MTSPINILSRSGLDLSRVYKIRGNVLFKKIKFSKHALRVPPALAVDYSILKEAQEKECVFLQLFDVENCEYYTVKISMVLSEGFKFNRGFGEQFALPLMKWIKTKTARIPISLSIETPCLPFAEVQR